MGKWPRRYLPLDLTEEDKILAESALMLLRTGEVPPRMVAKMYGYSSESVCQWHITQYLNPSRLSPYCWSEIAIADCVANWQRGRPAYMKEPLMCGECPYFIRDRRRTDVGDHVYLRLGVCSQSGKRMERCDYCGYYDSVRAVAESLSARPGPEIDQEEPADEREEKSAGDAEPRGKR